MKLKNIHTYNRDFALSNRHLEVIIDVQFKTFNIKLEVDGLFDFLIL